MEFFSWLNFSQLLFELFGKVDEMTDVNLAVRQMLMDFYISLGIAGGILIVTLIFGGIGLCAMAKKQGKKAGILAFLPFTNLYVAGKLAGEASFFGQKMKREGLYAMIAELLYAAVEVCRVVANVLLIAPEYYTLQTDATAGITYWDLGPLAQEQWMYGVLEYGRIATYVLDLFTFIFVFVLFFALFKKYYAKSPLLMTFLCTLFPVRGFVLFAVRNNTPVDYNEFLRRRAEEYARANNPYGYGGYNPPPPYNPPYNGQNGGGQPSSGGGEDPFGGEFGTPPPGNDGASGDPFDEFH